METPLKLGKLPARKNAITFKFGAYTSVKLPPAPAVGGHLDIAGGMSFGMLANDQHGDCVWAGAAHETMLWNKEAEQDVLFDDSGVLSDYSAVTGFNPADPSTDQGTDMELAAKYRRTTGVLDAKGVRHKIGAYLDVNKVSEIKQAVHLLSVIGIGIRFPSYAMDQFRAGKPWTFEQGGQILGGHYVPVIAYDKQYAYVVTWGKVQLAKWAFIKKYMDEGIAYLSTEMLQNGKSLEGFNIAQLQEDLAAL